MRARKVKGGAACRIKDGDIQLVMNIDKSWLSTIAKYTSFDPIINQVQFPLNVTSGDITSVYSIDRQTWPVTYLDEGETKSNRKTCSIRLEKLVKDGTEIDLESIPRDEEEPEPWTIRGPIFNASCTCQRNQTTGVKIESSTRLTSTMKSRHTPSAKGKGTRPVGSHDFPIDIDAEHEETSSNSGAGLSNREHSSRTSDIDWSDSDSDIGNTPLAKRMKLGPSTNAGKRDSASTDSTNDEDRTQGPVVVGKIDITKEPLQTVRITTPIGTGMTNLPRTEMGSFGGASQEQNRATATSLGLLPVQTQASPSKESTVSTNPGPKALSAMPSTQAESSRSQEPSTITAPAMASSTSRPTNHAVKNNLPPANSSIQPPTLNVSKATTTPIVPPVPEPTNETIKKASLPQVNSSPQGPNASTGSPSLESIQSMAGPTNPSQAGYAAQVRPTGLTERQKQKQPQQQGTAPKAPAILGGSTSTDTAPVTISRTDQDSTIQEQAWPMSDFVPFPTGDF